MTAIDPFPGTYPGMEGPYVNGAAVTPDDNADLPTIGLALYVGGAGDVTLVISGGDTLLFKAVPVGTTLRVRAKRVKSTGTTATQLLNLY